jgi:hypothetical protein
MSILHSDQIRIMLTHFTLIISVRGVSLLLLLPLMKSWRHLSRTKGILLISFRVMDSLLSLAVIMMRALKMIIIVLATLGMHLLLVVQIIIKGQSKHHSSWIHLKTIQLQLLWKKSNKYCLYNQTYKNCVLTTGRIKL